MKIVGYGINKPMMFCLFFFMVNTTLLNRKYLYVTN